MPDAAPVDLSATLSRADRLHRVAEQLFRSGDVAEAVRLEQGALRAVMEQGALEQAVSVLAPAAAACLMLRPSSGPLDAASLAEAEAHFDELDRLRRGFVDAAVESGEAAAWCHARRWRRIRLALAIVVVCAVAASYLFRPTASQIRVRASAHFPGLEFLGPNAVDGNVRSEWLLPDHVPGWLDIRLDPPRNVAGISLRNSHNGYFNDRATQAFDIELWAGDRQIRTVAGTFAVLDPTPDWLDVPVRASGVSRVVFRVRSHFGAGGGLAEMRFAER